MNGYEFALAMQCGYEQGYKDGAIAELEKMRSAIVKEIKDRNNDSSNKDIMVGLSIALAIIQKKLDEVKGE